MVLQNFGAIEKCYAQLQTNNTVWAEIQFVNRTVADMAVEQFDGASADGQIIRAYVTKTPSIVVEEPSPMVRKSELHIPPGPAASSLGPQEYNTDWQGYA